MLIEIKREDIRNAKEARRKFDDREAWHYARAESCPLAFALARTLKRPNSEVWVGPSYINIGRSHIVAHTEEVKAFISETDKKKDRIRPRKLEIPLE